MLFYQSQFQFPFKSCQRQRTLSKRSTTINKLTPNSAIIIIPANISSGAALLHESIMKYPNPSVVANDSAKNKTAIAVPMLRRRAVRTSGKLAGKST